MRFDIEQEKCVPAIATPHTDGATEERTANFSNRKQLKQKSAVSFHATGLSIVRDLIARPQGGLCVSGSGAPRHNSW